MGRNPNLGTTSVGRHSVEPRVESNRTLTATFARERAAAVGEGIAGRTVYGPWLNGISSVRFVT